jgi:hypothetical protein
VLATIHSSSHSLSIVWVDILSVQFEVFSFTG